MSLVFRPEALDAQRQPWLGPVQLVRPASLNFLTLGVLLTLVLVGALLFFGEYTRKARIGGVLVPDLGLIRLVPPMQGQVLKSNVAEGRSVDAGDVLFVLGLESSTLSADVQARVRRSLDERRRSLLDTRRQVALLSDSQAASMRRRLIEMDREHTQFDAEAALHQQRMALAQQALQRLEALSRDKFISPAQVQTKKEEYIGLQAQAQALQRQSAALARERAALQGELRGLPLVTKAREGEIERDLAGLARETAEQDARREVVVRAPQDGTITAVMAEPGQSVSPASALASLIPAGAQLQAQLYAPSGAVGFLKSGQEVRLRFEAFPYQKYGHQMGHVVQVSRTPLAAAELAGLPFAAPAAQDGTAEPLFRIIVAMDHPFLRADGEKQPLVAGMRMEADVLLERRRLIEWLFEPLLGLSGRL